MNIDMGFTLTVRQVRRRQKTVTRRLEYPYLKIGDLVNAVVDNRAGKSGKVEHICHIKILDIRTEPLKRMLYELEYGVEECDKEGFPELSPGEFVDLFCGANMCGAEVTVTRIEFEYV